MDWFDRAEDELCAALNRGEITQAEYQREMREIAAELRAQAEDAAEQAYNDTMGGW